MTTAGLEWRQVTVLRAYSRFRNQLHLDQLDARELEAALITAPSTARHLFEYFESLFSPQMADHPLLASQFRDCVLDDLNQSSDLEQDLTVRGYLRLIDATSRTNFFSSVVEPSEHPILALKFDSSVLPDRRLPEHYVETFVHGPSVEGVHVRWGRIPRGGLRHSIRLNDFRTEALGLALAQVKKNSNIVPTGAKGTFVCRADDPMDGDTVRSAYGQFVGALLDITDNVVEGRVVTPQGLIARDGPDPYLVVAADRGTASLSDNANAISAERGYWLGDAFAAGGSHGYDHKAMGITARGAWVAAQRHFQQIGIDIQSDGITVAGVGDMSGDVFGNGMLLSDSVRLVAAFDHRHIFLDPTPDPDRSFSERSRIASLPRSTWNDYDRDALSVGGGVWPRSARRVPLSPEAQRSLGIDSESFTPPELVSTILSAPVDLLWLGGVGTFVRHGDESDAEVEDKGNDGVRITADRLRARVVVEGANLGLTQPRTDPVFTSRRSDQYRLHRQRCRSCHIGP